MGKRSSWTTRVGFYLAAVGSAAGLGNLWRFPYIVGENGGGAFVLMYIFLVLTIGLSLMIGELILGKSTGKSVLLATGQLANSGRINPRFRWVGRFAILLSLFVLSYYSVISGWALHFSTLFFVNLFSETLKFDGSMQALVGNGWLQSGLVSVHLVFVTIIVLKGIEEGMEKWVAWMMPIFGILILTLVFKSLSLPTSTEALRFLFYPDFSKLTWSSLVHAIGHVGFTLSVGFGTLVTFGSYLGDREHIPTAGFRVAVSDTLISLTAGLLIFPIALGASDIPLTDPRLMFEVLPSFINSQPGGAFFGFGFFICLYLASLNATIGLFENVVSNWMDRTRIKRRHSTWIVGGVLFGMSLIPAFSGSYLRQFRWADKGILELVDSVVINWILPLIILGMSIAIARGMSESEKEKWFVNSHKVESATLFPYWKSMMLWGVPLTVGVALLLQMIGLLLGS